MQLHGRFLRPVMDNHNVFGLGELSNIKLSHFILNREISNLILKNFSAYESCQKELKTIFFT